MYSGKIDRKTDRQRDKERQKDRQKERQTDKESKAQAQRYVYFSGAFGVSYCLLVCFARVGCGHLQPSTSDKIRFALYYAYNIANI